jgi:hypothetical protein
MIEQIKSYSPVVSRLCSGEKSLNPTDTSPNLDEGIPGGVERKKIRRSQAPGQKSRSKKPNGKPKRPLTAKIGCFFEELKTKTQNEKGHIDYQLLRMVAEEGWSRMGPEQQELYETRASEDKETCREEMKNFTEMKPKKRAKRHILLTPSCPSPSPETSPVATKQQVHKNTDSSQSSSSRSASQLSNPFTGAAVHNIEKDTPVHHPGSILPSPYHNSKPTDYPATASMEPVDNREFSGHNVAVCQPVQVLPLPPLHPPTGSPPVHYVHHQYSSVDDRFFRTAPSMPMSSHRHTRAPQQQQQQQQTKYLPPGPRREQPGTSPPALLRPRMEVALSGPDGVTRKYILHYKCISMKRDEVPAFIEHLSQGGGRGESNRQTLGSEGVQPICK